MIRRFSLAAAVVLTVGTTVASATPITYSGLDNPRGTLTNSLAAESQFKAALSVFGTETVDALSGNNPTLVFGATGITAFASNTGAGTDAALAVSAPKLLGELAGNEVFTFNLPVQGFGTFFVGAGTHNFLPTTFTFVLENTVLHTSQTVSSDPLGPNLLLNNVAYFGVIDTASPFNLVTVHTSNEGDVFLYDNLTAGLTAVPEPASLTLLATGAIGFLARRRQLR